MPTDPTNDLDLDSKVAAVKSAESFAADAADANAAAQSKLVGATADAESANAASNDAHAALASSVDDLIAFLTRLKA